MAWPSISKLKSTTAYFACLLVYFLLLLQLLTSTVGQLILKHASHGCRTSCNFFSSAQAIYESRLQEVKSSYLKMDEHGGHICGKAMKSLDLSAFHQADRTPWPHPKVLIFRLVQQICELLQQKDPPKTTQSKPRLLSQQHMLPAQM